MDPVIIIGDLLEGRGRLDNNDGGGRQFPDLASQFGDFLGSDMELFHGQGLFDFIQTNADQANGEGEACGLSALPLG